MDSRPLVSCVVPVFNGARFLEDAVQSIEAQTWRPIEIIVVDDGSTDGTPDVIERIGDRVVALRQSNLGPPAARNAGVRAASGDFIAFLDADDLWLPEKLAVQMARFEARPELELCVGIARNWWIDELRHEADGTPDTMGGVSAALFRRTLVDRLGPLDEALRHLDWVEWMLRGTDLGVVAETISEPLALRRIHHDNLSRRRQDEEPRERARVAQTRIARLRRNRT